MGTCLPFSEIDKYFSGLTERACLADTSFLISVSDEDSPFFEDSQFVLEKLIEYEIPVFSSVTTRSEFIDYHRRVIITETLMDMLAPTSRWKITEAVRNKLKVQRGWIDNQPSKGSDPYLTDTRIKECKQTFLPKTQSGKIGWAELCHEYLSGRLISAWTQIVDLLNLTYIDMRADDAKDLFRKELNWKSMYRLAEESALGSQDAMILNLLDDSRFPFVVTTDFDLAYGVLLSIPDKTVLVPDNLYRNRLKKLRF